MSLLYDPDNPFRPVDWRWGRAAEIVRGGGRPTGEDAWVRRAVAFVRAKEGCADERSLEALRDRDPALYWAGTIREKRDAADPASRLRAHAVEARVLARQSFAAIAAVQGVSSAVAEAYCRLHFDFEGRIDCLDYVATTLFGRAFGASLSNNDYELIWKIYAYTFGPTYVDAFLSTFHAVDVDRARNKGPRGAAFSALAVRALIAVKTMALDERTLGPVLSEFHRAAEREEGRRAVESAEGRDVATDDLAAVFAAAAYGVRGGRVNREDAFADAAALLDEQPAEYRSGELVRIAAGVESTFPGAPKYPVVAV